MTYGAPSACCVVSPCLSLNVRQIRGSAHAVKLFASSMTKSANTIRFINNISSRWRKNSWRVFANAMEMCGIKPRKMYEYTNIGVRTFQPNLAIRQASASSEVRYGCCLYCSPFRQSIDYQNLTLNRCSVDFRACDHWNTKSRIDSLSRSAENFPLSLPISYDRIRVSTPERVCIHT